MSRGGLATLLLTAMPTVAVAQDALVKRVQSAEFEAPRVYSAAELLPAEMVQGDYWVVLDGVEVFDSMLIFRVRSDYGDFDVEGELMLRTLLRELDGLHELEEMGGGKLAAKAAGRAAVKSFKRFGQFVSHPVKSVKEVPGGLVRRFKKVARDVNEVAGDVQEVQAARAEGDEEAASDAARTGANRFGRMFFGVDSAERRWARNLGVDPYTTNPVLRDALRKAGKIDVVASMGTKSIVPSIPGVSYFADIEKLVSEKDARELLEINRGLLLDMEIHPDLVDRLLGNESFSLSRLTLLTTALAEMEGVGGRRIVVEQAATVEAEAEALFTIESVVLTGWFHETQAPLDRFVPGTLIPVALTEDGRIVVFTGADYAHWNEENAPVAREFTETYRPYSDRMEVWVAGQATPRWQSEVERLGWTVETGVRAELLPRLPWGGVRVLED